MLKYLHAVLREKKQGKLGLFPTNCNNSDRKLGNGDSQND
jgi:hypothetical protein